MMGKAIARDFDDFDDEDDDSVVRSKEDDIKKQCFNAV